MATFNGVKHLLDDNHKKHRCFCAVPKVCIVVNIGERTSDFFANVRQF